MKKIILLLAIAFCFGKLQAQVICTDTVSSAEVQRINENLAYFYKANRASQRWYAVSVVCFVGNTLKDNSNTKGSYKYLNPKYKKPAKVKLKM